jgi:LmbE family N-acetylglucosaminyl deacetylase
MNVLAVGAHPDDIELGCGGALLAHRRAGDRIAMLVMTAGELGPKGDAPRVIEQETSAAKLGATLHWGGFEDGRVPQDSEGVAVLESLVRQLNPDVVYTHAAGDTHQDHRATHGVTIAATRRSSRVLCYEAPSTIGFVADVSIDLEGLLEEKLALLMCHRSQVERCGPVDLEAIEAQARFRGFQARARFAEAFESHRFLWNIGVPAAAKLTSEVAESADNLFVAASESLASREAPFVI